MIIKKPYAFFIRHFRIIHLLMLVPMLFLTLNFGDMTSFIRKYADTMNTAQTNIAGNYITIFTFLAILVLLAVNITIYTLMKSKRKPTKFYLINSIYYIVLLAMSLLYFAIFQEIDKGKASETLVQLVSGIAVATLLPSYILMPATLMQGLGFNIKTFKFDKVMDLQIVDDDSEEVEVKFLKGNGEIKKNVIHSVRELKYYALENKEIFTLIGIVLVLVIAISIYLDVGVYNKRYNLNQAFALDSFTMTVKESYITDVDYSGNQIADDKYYLAIKLAIYNKTLESQSIDKSNFRLYFDNKIIYPDYGRSGRFTDIGKNYQGGMIPAQKADEYVLVYELDSSMVKGKYQMKILSSVRKEPGKLIPSYKIINIRPKNIVEMKKLSDASVGDSIDLSKTTLGNTKITLKRVNYASRYVYYYDQCSELKKCISRKSSISPKSSKTFIVIEDAESWDEESSYYKNGKKDFYEDFVTIEYDYTNAKGDTKTYESKMVNVTPSVLTNVRIYEVNNLVPSGDNIKFCVRIRNQKFYIKIGKLGELVQ